MWEDEVLLPVIEARKHQVKKLDQQAKELLDQAWEEENGRTSQTIHEEGNRPQPGSREGP